MRKEDSLYLEHILNCINRIVSYSEEFTQEAFGADFLVQDACIRQLEVLGEATKHISFELRDSYPEIPWKQMAGMRDVLIHDYLNVDLNIVWKTVSESIPALQPKIALLLQKL